ncbi:hypothetical protein SD71_08835 [Cohnella kolymensis]|uniref:Uncharacterized protein n=1 Tax=Cohnella kolymensis TaxID=1590652 RepID=A0ABR5A5F2_9BACL|nr:hypothetical protein [Cohnella kolymensis]KIL36259.1 hypothetical protein SD71_08835 [Cohnella kolymensis]
MGPRVGGGPDSAVYGYNPYMERYPETGDSYTPSKENSPFGQRSVVEPEMKRFARNVAAFVQTAQNVVDMAAALQALTEIAPHNRDSFIASVNRLLEQDEQHFKLLDTMDPQEDAAYILSFEEFVAHWAKTAALILAAPPLDLIADEDRFHSYAAYSEDKEKTWQLPHQGWLFQTYG